MKSQTDVIVDNIQKHGFLYRKDYINFIRSRGQKMDQGLVHARLKYINEHPIKYNLPENVKIGRGLVLNPKGLTEHIYTYVDKRTYVTPKATDCKKRFA